MVVTSPHIRRRGHIVRSTLGLRLERRLGGSREAWPWMPLGCCQLAAVLIDSLCSRRSVLYLTVHRTGCVLDKNTASSTNMTPRESSHAPGKVKRALIRAVRDSLRPKCKAIDVPKGVVGGYRVYSTRASYAHRTRARASGLMARETPRVVAQATLAGCLTIALA